MAAIVEWAKLTAPELNAMAAAGATVLLPVASTEQHGPHLGT
ncbi:MAG: creatininase family protein, partial [Phreatobacter sp.]|nr:creatininase family protein [Phreatobacter sp.]